MPEQSETRRTAAAVMAQIEASARGRARTARHLRVHGPGAIEEVALLALTTVVFGFGLIALI